jgi:hypothetical protein
MSHVVAKFTLPNKGHFISDLKAVLTHNAEHSDGAPTLRSVVPIPLQARMYEYSAFMLPRVCSGLGTGDHYQLSTGSIGTGQRAQPSRQQENKTNTDFNAMHQNDKQKNKINSIV